MKKTKNKHWQQRIINTSYKLHQDKYQKINTALTTLQRTFYPQIWWWTNCLWCLWWSVLEHTTNVYQQFTSMLDHFQFSSLANIPANNQSSSFYYIYTAHIHAVPEIISSAVSSNRMQKQQLLQFFYQPCSVNGPSCTSLGVAAWRRLQLHLQDKKGDGRRWRPHSLYNSEPPGLIQALLLHHAVWMKEDVWFYSINSFTPPWIQMK